MAHEVAADPAKALQALVEVVVDLCRAGSAAISIVESEAGSAGHRWLTAAGALAQSPELSGAWTPGPGSIDADPAPTVLVQNTIGAFPELGAIAPRITESLLAPWHSQDRHVGTLWAMKHAPEERFDAEDARILEGLAPLAASAWRLMSAADPAMPDRAPHQEDSRSTARGAREARQAFLLDLDNRLRPLDRPEEIQIEAARAIGQHLGVHRVGYAEAQPDDGSIVIMANYTDGVPDIEGRYRHEAFRPELVRPFEDGQIVVRTDIANDPELTAAEKRVYADRGVGAAVNAPLLRAGRLVAVLFMHCREARAWTDAEIELLEAGAERIWDTVSRARANARLQAREEELRLITDNTPALIGYIDREGRFEFVNETACRFFGHTREEILGRLQREIVGERVYARLRPGIEAALRGQTVRFDDTEPDKYGPGLHGITEENYIPRYGSNGDVEGYYFFAVDISERKRAESALRESEERFRTLVENLPDYAIFLLDATGVVTEWTVGAERVKGYTATEAVGRHLAFCYTPEDIAAGMLERELAIASAEGRYENEGWRVRKGGERFWANEIATAIRDRDGQLVGFTKISRDLTRQRRAQQALAASEERYRTLFESMDQGFCILKVIFDDADNPVDYRFVEINPVFQQQTGLEDPRGRTARELVPNLEESWFRTYGRVALTGEPTRFVDHSEPMGRWFDVFAFRIGEANERTVALLFTDITDRRRRETNLVFLSGMSEVFSRLSSSEEIIHAVGERTGTFLGGSSCFLVDVDDERDEGWRRFIWTRAGTSPVPARIRFSELLSEEFRRAARAGEAIVVNDTQADPRTDAEAYANLDIGSFVTIPFERDGKWRYLFTVCDTRPRGWRDDEVEVMRDLSYRIFPRLERARAEERLRASEERFRTLIQRSSDAIQLVSRDGTILYSSASVETVLGYSPEDILGKSIAPFVHPDDLAGVGTWIAGVAAEPGRVATHHYRIRHRNGLWLWIEATLANHLDTPNINALVGNFRNISGRKAAEDALRESEERFRTIVEEATDYAIFAMDAQNRIQTWPPGAQAAFGWEPRDVIGQSFNVTFIPDDREAGAPEQEVQTARDHGIAPDVRWHQRKDGSRVFIEGSTYALRSPEGWLRGYFKIGRDVTDRLRADQARQVQEEQARQDLETQVFAATAESRMLSRRLLEVQEDERRHLARELHDEIGQVLTGLGLRLGASGPRDESQLADARQIVQELTDQVRQLSMDLRPAALDTYGLLPALLWHIERYQAQIGVRVDLRHEGIGRRFPAPVEIAAYRIVQEALTNVARHARAGVATVQLLAEDDVLNVSIRDDGRGFDPRDRASSSGLSGMRERVELLGGVIAIDAVPGSGVVVTAEIPLGDVRTGTTAGGDA